MKIKYLYIKTLNFTKTINGFLRNGVFLNYCIEKNAGDMFNVDFLSKAYNQSVLKYSFGKNNHYLFCGSILGRSNKYSTIIGAGFISEEQSKSRVKYNKVIGVRGKLTETALLKNDKEITVDFLGDPGLLAREIITPRDENNFTTNGIIGVIPHFMDLKKAKSIIKKDKGFKIIDIRKDFESVCNEILTCDVVLSSSLHGLIFSDSMNVSNYWIKFSDNLVGGDFKFQDYYSVMTNPKAEPKFCNNINDLKKVSLMTNVSRNEDYDNIKTSVENNLRIK